jgi:hypothetical protein
MYVSTPRSFAWKLTFSGVWPMCRHYGPMCRHIQHLVWKMCSLTVTSIPKTPISRLLFMHEKHCSRAPNLIFTVQIIAPCVVNVLSKFQLDRTTNKAGSCHCSMCRHYVFYVSTHSFVHSGVWPMCRHHGPMCRHHQHLDWKMVSLDTIKHSKNTYNVKIDQ